MTAKLAYGTVKSGLLSQATFHGRTGKGGLARSHTQSVGELASIMRKGRKLIVFLSQ